ncbi:MAG TPA: hypothetical protein DCX07_12430 [Phycisphaerales bacterium]|nr:hypothetical protein [Phycisphaerales bacterium]
MATLVCLLLVIGLLFVSVLLMVLSLLLPPSRNAPRCPACSARVSYTQFRQNRCGRCGSPLVSQGTRTQE